MSRSLALALALVALLPAACAHDEAQKKDAPEKTAPTKESVFETDTVPLTAVQKGPVRDLPAIREAGVLRVLVHFPDQTRVPRAGSPLDRELALVEQLARAEGLHVQYVEVPGRAHLLDALLDGRGDIIASQLTRTDERAARVVFTRPVRAIEELVVVPKATEKPPKEVQDLAGQTVHVRTSSSYAERLRNLDVDVQIAPLPETLSPQQILARVGKGEIPLTVVDSDAWETYRLYHDDVAEAFVLHEKVAIGWALSPGAPALEDAVERFFEGRKLVYKRRYIFGGDLQDIQRRGLLRVVLPNNASSYFIHQGQATGFQLEIAEDLADKLGVRLEVVVPRRHEDMIPLVLDEHADLIGAALSITEDRKAKVRFSDPLLEVDEVLIQPAGEPALTDVNQLAGRQVHVRKSSSYFRTLTALQEKVPTLEIVPVPEHVETEEIIGLVGKGEVPLTVADVNVAAIEMAFRDDVQASLVLHEDRPLAFAMRQGSIDLARAVNDFVKERKDTLAAQTPELFRRPAEKAAKLPKGALSPYDALAKDIGAARDVDWRLLVAVMREQSGFDPTAQTWTGGRGLMGLLDETARDYGATRLNDPRENLDAGAQHLAALRAEVAAELGDEAPPEDVWLFTLAAYRAGFEHVQDARALAREQGKDPARWFGEVEAALRLLEKPTYAQQADAGYVRGDDVADWTERVSKRWRAYQSASDRAAQ